MQPPVNLLIANNINSSDLPLVYKTPSADVRHFVLPQLGIKEVRQIIEAASSRSWGVSDYVFVIECNSLTTEAQNAMLKLFEEPPESSRLYLILPSESLLLPTLRSRFVAAVKQPKVSDLTLARDFMKLSYAARLELISTKAKAKDQSWMDMLLTQLIELDQQERFNDTSKRSLLLAENYIKIRGASKKALLEELALTLDVY